MIIKSVRHQIGSCYTYQTALLCCAYMSKRIGKESFFQFDHDDYDIYHPWFIFYVSYPDSKDRLMENDVDICRAFVAGRGEVWA